MVADLHEGVEVQGVVSVQEEAFSPLNAEAALLQGLKDFGELRAVEVGHFQCEDQMPPRLQVRPRQSGDDLGPHVRANDGSGHNQSESGGRRQVCNILVHMDVGTCWNHGPHAGRGVQAVELGDAACQQLHSGEACATSEIQDAGQSFREVFEKESCFLSHVGWALPPNSVVHFVVLACVLIVDGHGVPSFAAGTAHFVNEVLLHGRHGRDGVRAWASRHDYHDCPDYPLPVTTQDGACHVHGDKRSIA